MTKIVLCGALISVISLSAQDQALVEKKLAEAKVRLDEIKVLGTSMINGPTVKGAPYSAQAVNEMVQVLADGNRITNSSSTMLYRDSQGRERREEEAGRAIFIADPVDGVSYSLEPKAKVAHKSPQKAVSFAYTTGSGTGVGAGSGRLGPVVTESRTFIMNDSGHGPETLFFSNIEVNSSKTKPTVEHLGTQTIEGVSAEGTRTTVTIPAGQIGNDLPIVTVSERWYSPELQVTVMNKRTDPRTGTTTYKLTNIIRSEPSPSLFQVPADYTVADPSESKRIMLRHPEEEQR